MGGGMALASQSWIMGACNIDIMLEVGMSRSHQSEKVVTLNYSQILLGK